MDNTVKIYALCDPRTQEVRYVGSSINPKRRARHHRYEYSKKRNAWLDELKELNLRPILKILETTSEECRFERERHWYLFYNNEGCDLVNGKFTPVAQGKNN